MASSYYCLDDYERSVDFLEKALVEKNPSFFDSLSYLSMLHASYIKLGNTSKETEVEGKLLDLFDAIIDQPYFRVHMYLPHYNNYLTTLRVWGETEKAIALYENIINSMKELQAVAFIADMLRLFLKLLKIC